MGVDKIKESSPPRIPLSRERVLTCAVSIADSDGIGALTMRSLARALEVKPMSLYYHVANKAEILDAITDMVFAEVDIPSAAGQWRREMRRRADSMRAALGRHSWAIGLLESRVSPGLATLRHHDATLGVLRAAGLSVKGAAHAYALLDSYIYGFALQEAALPFHGPDAAAGATEQIVKMFAAGDYPHLMEIAAEHVMQPGYDFGDEFEIGLELILDSLQGWIPKVEVGPEARSPAPRDGAPSAVERTK